MNSQDPPPGVKRALPASSVFRQTAYVTAGIQSMKYPVYYLDEPGNQDILEAANPRDAAQQFYSKHPRNESCCIRVETGGVPKYSHFDAVQFMDESARTSARASLPPVPLQSLVTGRPSAGAPGQEEVRRVVVTDIDMRFWSMVFFMVKWAFATIPAIIIICVIVVIVMAFFGLLSHK